jgi:hypothetical protein
MSETVWKYEFTSGPGLIHRFSMPEGAEPLSVGMQGDLLCMWARVKPDAAEYHRGFIAIGTGRLDGVGLGAFVGRATQGPYEWHVFEVAR